MAVDRTVKNFAVVDKLPDGFVPANEIRSASGGGRAFAEWLIRRGYTRHTRAVVVKGYQKRARVLAVRADVAEEYERYWGLPRAAARPRGWPNRKKAVARVGSEVYFRRALAEGLVRGVKVGRYSYYDPEGIEAARIAYVEASRPRVDWEKVRDLEREAGVTKGYGAAWLDRYADRVGLDLSRHTAVLAAPEGGRAAYWSPELCKAWRDRARLPRKDPYERVKCPLCGREVSRNTLPLHSRVHNRGEHGEA